MNTSHISHKEENYFTKTNHMNGNNGISLKDLEYDPLYSNNISTSLSDQQRTQQPPTQILRTLKDMMNENDDDTNIKLTGQKVEIPLTKKAFFLGTLSPTISTEKEGKVEEQVMMNIGQGILCEMSTKKACEFLDRRFRRQLVTSTNKTTTKIIKKDTSSQVTDSSLDQPSPSPSPSSLPFFEIREEIDEYGNEISSQTINISQELQDFKNKANSTATNNNNKNESNDNPQQKEIHDLLQQINLSNDDTDMTSSLVTNNTNTSITSHDSNNNGDGDRKQKFDKALSTLSQLEKLEEKEERKKKANRKSSKKLQGGSWAKGFLNNNKNNTNNSSTSTAKKYICKKKKKVVVEKNGQNYNSNTRNGQVKEDNANDVITSTKKVMIQEEKNQVQYIPKIGQHSINAIKQQQQQQQYSPYTTNNNNTTIAPQSQKMSLHKKEIKPIERNVFNGIVAERKSNDPVSSTTSTAPKKKLSRFAQQRLERQQQQQQGYH